MTIVREVRPDPGFDLARYADSPAVVHDGGTVTYAELDALVRERARLLGTTRRLVLVEGGNELTPLVTYLAALSGGHPVLLVPSRAAAGAQWDRLVAAYDPDVLCTSASGWELHQVRRGTRHDLHPDLALLLGTSGSTGTPKLVRLSQDNIRANAEAIAGYLHLGPESRAATTLPMHYCYGLSVVNSHLVAGGSIWLTSRSVVDEGFWPGFNEAGATSFAGVPYTFELLERSGVDWTRQPGLRQVTQAGGRMPAERVRELALRSRQDDVELFVMYGATEATARMAYLPPHLAAERPHTIGIPIEGGEFRLDEGELVYVGRNVMLGYAGSPADLAAGRTVTELRTGDLAVQHDDGLYEIVGRRNRVAKLFGTRLDLDLAERLLDERGIGARLVSDDRTISVFVRDPTSTGPATRALTESHCVPAHAVDVHVVEEFPTTTNGKPDYATLRRLATEAGDEGDATATVDVRSAYEVVFGRRVSGSDTFIGLGGDSLSYVEMVVRLERALGRVPADWPQRTVDELAAGRSGRRGLLARIEMPLVMRAVAILLIVGSHVELWDVMGGAHALLVLLGYNLARFALHAPDRWSRLRAVGRSVRAIALPTIVWVGGAAVVTGAYAWPTVLFLNGALGDDRWSEDWQFWFLETAVWTMAGLGVVTVLPHVDRALRRWPFHVPLAMLGGTLALRASVADEHTVATYSVAATAWCVVLGWLVASTRTRSQRVLASLLVPVCTHGFFGPDLTRELVVVLATLAIIWLPHVAVPRPVDRAVTWIGGASLFVYLTHWQVYPPLERDHPELALLASLAVGIAAWRTYALLHRALARVLQPSRVAGWRRTGSESTP